MKNLHENLIQLREQWIQLEDILQELETKSYNLLEKDKNLDLTVRSKENLLSKNLLVQVSTDRFKLAPHAQLKRFNKMQIKIKADGIVETGH